MLACCVVRFLMIVLMSCVLKLHTRLHTVCVQRFLMTLFSMLTHFVSVCAAAGTVPSSAAVRGLPTHPYPPGDHRRDQRS